MDVFGDDRKAAERALKAEVEALQREAASVEGSAMKLYQLRVDCQKVIAACQAYINSLATVPKDLRVAVDALVLEYSRFEGEMASVQALVRTAAIEAGSVAGAGVAAGVGFAALAPSAAMAIATTFGTASTGAAISGLTGAAATNAALAWLGGGALAAGGGGMAAGQAFLALAGPIGWTIGGIGLISSFFLMGSRNAEIARELHDRRVQVRGERNRIARMAEEIGYVISQTEFHARGLWGQLMWLREPSGGCCSCFFGYGSEIRKRQMALINNVNSLRVLISWRTDGSE